MPEARLHYQDHLDNLEKNCLGGIDLVVASLDRTWRQSSTRTWSSRSW